MIDDANGKVIAQSKAEERAQKLLEIRRVRRKRVLIAGLAAVALVFLTIQLYRSGLFNVRNIDIAGNKFVSTVKIVEICGVNENTNILSVPTAEIQEKLLQDPWIKSSSIKRGFPCTLRIEVQERVPVALISHASKFYLIDEEFFVIAERQYAEGLEVPTITDLSIEKIRVGDRFINDSLSNTIKCLKSMDPEFRKGISLLSASSIDKLSLYTKANIEILYGEAKEPERKNKVLQTILKEQGKQVILVDIRDYPHSDPVIKRMDSVP